MMNLTKILEKSSAGHTHLCPRQVLGARIGLAGMAALGFDAPQRGKRLLVILETDGCFADGVIAATGATVGHRTLRVEDYGKIAATFINVRMETAVRVFPQLDVRKKALQYAPEERKHYFAQLIGYQRMPDSELLTVQRVSLTVPVRTLISRAGVRANCTVCGEEIINERERIQSDQVVCHACAGTAYYALV